MVVDEENYKWLYLSHQVKYNQVFMEVPQLMTVVNNGKRMNLPNLRAHDV